MLNVEMKCFELNALIWLVSEFKSIYKV